MRGTNIISTEESAMAHRNESIMERFSLLGDFVIEIIQFGTGVQAVPYPDDLAPLPDDPHTVVTMHNDLNKVPLVAAGDSNILHISSQ